MAEFGTNSVAGLASGMDTKTIVKDLVAAEQKKLEPVKMRQEQKTVELDAWKQVKATMDKVKGSSEILSKRGMWEGKIVTSSHPEVVEAIATSGAKPGKHTLVVDKLALSHQIASQNFAEKDSQIGEGRVLIQVGEEEPRTIGIDGTNNTLQGFVDAINKEELGVTANIINTGNKERPFQIVLTSNKTGSEGKIGIQIELKGEGEAPTFDPYYNQPSKWKDVKKLEDAAKKPTGTGASTAIPQLVGIYKGEDPLELSFTVVNTGTIGVSENLRLRWEDDQERYGYIDLGSFNYTPGEPIPIVDGISLVMTEGEILVNDTFEAYAKPQESELFWWKNEAERAPSITQPSSWGKQATEGGPVITGKLDTGENDSFTLTVRGSGAVGQADDLQIEYVSENGIKGTAYVGRGYEPGSKLSLGHGLELSLKSGILTEGSFSTFDYQAGSTENFWWLDDEERIGGDQAKNVTNWQTPEEEEGDFFARAKGLAGADMPSGPRVSTADKQIVGKYDSYESRIYTFTALKTGGIGVTKDLELKWEDNLGNEGVLKVGGDAYKLGEPIAFDSGLSLVLGQGDIYEGHSFNFRTFSPVIQPPQDAEVRLGATESGGGLMITSSTNSLDDVIDGVKLNLLSTQEKPITISIKGDTEKAVASVTQFVTDYNEMLKYFIDVTAYDKETKTAGPLQGDRNLPRIQAETNRIFIDTVAGLAQDRNQLMNIGLKLGDDGLITIDEEKLKGSTEDDLSKVANLFRSHGQIENTGIQYLSSGLTTKVSGADGYQIDVTAAATKGSYVTKPILQPFTINETNNAIYISINGRESEEIKLAAGDYDAASMARELSRVIAADKYLGKLNVSITQDAGRITLRSNMTGVRSNAGIRISNPALVATHPLSGGVATDGTDVQGSINGEPMIGAGQILTGPEGTDYAGLKLYVTLTENQLGEGAEGKMVFTKGVGTKVLEYVENVMDESKGALGIYTKNVEEQLKGYDEEVKTLEERIETKREKLNEKFAKMESQLGQLKSEQNYLTKELSKLG